MGTDFFFVSTPFLLVRAAAAAAAVGVQSKSCFYEALNLAANTLGVGANRCAGFFYFSKLIWV